ncbi:MAG: HNH endonuclease signature motif containing protein [Bacteroidota bacterium]
MSNNTKSALLKRGIDSESTRKLVENGYTVQSLQQKSLETLRLLGIPKIQAIKLLDGRPPIPNKIFNQVLHDSKYVCCICREKNKGIIIHHIDEWSVSHNHNYDNLAVLCTEHHDEAHTNRQMTIMLSPKRIRSSRDKWYSQVKANDESIINEQLGSFDDKLHTDEITINKIDINKSKENERKLKHSLRLEKRVYKELIDQKFCSNRENFDQLLKNPASKFISSKVFIRDVNDKTYPNPDFTRSNKISPWFKTFFHDTYHNGIEFVLDAGIGTIIIMDENGYWEPLRKSDDSRKSNPKFKVLRAQTIGKIPYNNIVDFKANGDDYNPEPHLFCKFDINGMPYEEIYYKRLGNFLAREFDKGKQTIFK